MDLTYTRNSCDFLLHSCIFGNAKKYDNHSYLNALHFHNKFNPCFRHYNKYANTFTAPFYSTEITIDGLSAFFILVTNLTMLTGMLFSNGYLEPYVKSKKPSVIALHYGSYILLHLSMLLVLVFRNGFAFLVAWELMAVASFLLILFEGEILKTLKTAVNYLIQMQLALCFF